MKKIACEICGSSEIVKSGDLFECQSCGMKYQTEDIQKMMIEGTVEVKGTVKIDDKEKIDRMYVSAKNAQDIGDNELALKYYEDIFSLVSTDWEVLFFIQYNRAVIQARPVNWDDRAKRIKGMKLLNEQYQKSLPKFIKLIEEHSSLEDLEKLAKHTVDFVVVVFNAIKDFFIDKFNNQFSNDYCNEATQTIIVLRNLIREKFEDQVQIIEFLNENINSMYRDGATYGKSKGCYIATAIYGSYDCTEVWTLRRYRDYTLSKNIFGKVFVKIYYKLSPPFIKIFGKTKWFNNRIKKRLDNKVEKLQNKGIESTPYIDK